MTQESIDSNFTSMHPTVEFLEISDHYSFNANLHCKFKFNDYSPKEGDRVAIFKIGWSLVKDYVVFEWAPVATEDTQYSVTFNRHILPKNSMELYQICYISSENELHGASTPFQFYLEENLMSASTILPSKSSVSSMMQSQTLDKQKDKEIARLREENAMLKETLKILVSQNKDISINNYGKDIEELKEVTESHNSMLLEHQKELDTLKAKITEGGEEYRKLYLEKVRVERKYDKLRNKRTDKLSLDEEVKPISDHNFDIGELKSMPPFPSLLK